MLIEAAEESTPMTTEEQAAVEDEVKQYQPISSPKEAFSR
jgi:hypothetical protein